MSVLSHILSILNAGAMVLLLFRLARLKVSSVYRFLFLYVFVLAVETTALLNISIQTDLYIYTYIGFQSLNLLVACGVIREVYRLALAAHPALAAFGRTMVTAAVGVAVLLSAISFMLDTEVLQDQFLYAHRFFTVERIGDFMLLILLLVLTIYLTWFPIKLQQNVIIYASGFAVFFFARTFGLLAVNLLPQAQLPALSNAMLAVEVACVVFWVWGIRRESDDGMAVTGLRWNPAQMERVTQQLNSINAALARFNRR